MNKILNIRNEELPVRTNVERHDREVLSELLGRALASTYVLYHKTHAFHWNVTGPLFYAVHNLTDAQYKDMAEAVDQIAERVRAIGFPTPIGLSRYARESMVEDVLEFPDTGTMVQQLARDHQTLAEQLREIVKVAEDADDVYTADLLTSRIGFHEESAWMLNALIVQ